jgi:shikimate dehydrogenase
VTQHLMKHRYVVLGNPIAHSRSPFIHGFFARDTQQNIEYDKQLVALTQFASTLDQLRQDSCFLGCNVTLPFKLEALAYAKAHHAEVSPRALLAGAINTLKFEGKKIWADNTDGVGLVNDISQRQAVNLHNARVILLGAGGAARGVILPLFEAGVSHIVLSNRSSDKAQALLDSVRTHSPISAERVTVCSLAEAIGLGGDVIVNATSSALTPGQKGLAEQLETSMLKIAKPLANVKLAYDMVYGSEPTQFMLWAQDRGCEKISDGLGMLVEQAAESFNLWRGVRPETQTVYSELRSLMSAPQQVVAVS